MEKIILMFLILINAKILQGQDEVGVVEGHIDNMHIISFIFFIVIVILVIFLFWQKKRMKMILGDVTEMERSRESFNELQIGLTFALNAGSVSACIYDCQEDTFEVLNNVTFSNEIRTRGDLLELVHPDDRLIVLNADKAIQAGLSDEETFVVRMQINDKSLFYRFTLIPREQKGKVRHIIGAVKNISEEIKLELDLINSNILLAKKYAELNLNNQLLIEVLNQIPGLLFIKEVNSNLKYYMVNNAFCKMAAKTSDEVVGCYDYDLFPKDIAERYRNDDFYCIESNEQFVVDEATAKEGERSVWRTIKTPVSLANGVKLLMGISIDVTEVYLMKDKAEQSDVLKSQFLANMSHELRTPLNAIVGFSSLLVDTDDEDEKREFNDIIATNSELLLNLINDILDLSKMESGVVNFNDEFFNVNEFLDEVYLSFSIRVRENVALSCVRLEEESLSIKIDSKRFSQVLYNFLSNAVKYTPSGEIVFGCKVERNGIKMFVKDTGIGIAEKNKTKIFARFEKLDTFAEGTGLGLSICKAFVDLKQGEIGFDSTLGEGAYFWIWIPCEIKLD